MRGLALTALLATTAVGCARVQTLASSADYEVAQVDGDNDGLADEDDTCPEAPEDQDGFEDNDGCPDIDNDGDGILDVEDYCPDDPEDSDGYEDDDGCPETGEGTVRGYCEIQIVGIVTFDANSSNLDEQHAEFVTEVADVLRQNPQILLVRVEGHADTSERHEDHSGLSEQRAAGVLSQLVQHGVDESRLYAVGYADEMPLTAGESDDERRTNRRVSFYIEEVTNPGECR